MVYRWRVGNSEIVTHSCVKGGVVPPTFKVANANI